MPTLEEIGAQVEYLLKNPANKQRKAHFGLVDVEQRERIANPKGRTRFIRELDSPEAYSEWNLEWERWILGCGGHKPIAQDLMLRALQQYSQQMIEKLAEDEQREEPAGLGNHG